MDISAVVRNSAGSHLVELCTGEVRQALAVAPKPVGKGSAVNGGEFLMLALAEVHNTIRAGAPVTLIELE